MAYLGQLDESGRLGVQQAAENRSGHSQKELFEKEEPEWVEVDASKVRVEKCRDFGGPWFGLELIRSLGLDDFFEKVLKTGREDIPWSRIAQVLILARLCDPSSELHIAEHFYRHTALSDLLGIPSRKVNDDRLYRAMDAILPHKEDLERFLKQRLGEMFDLEYDLLLYDVTSTYFEGEALANNMAQRGYSRDRRPDCKQVCIGLVVSKEGMPLGYEVFDGNRSDVTTLQDIVEEMEGRYGTAQRIWVLDRGMISENNMEFLKEDNRQYIVGAPKGMLKRFERELLKEKWETIREGLEVKLCSSEDGRERFILCRSSDRREKEKAMHKRFEKRIEAGLEKIEEGCAKRKYKVVTIAKRLGKLLGRNSRAAGLFKTDVVKGKDGRAKLVWEKVESWREWSTISEGCYLLRTNITDWSAEDLWKAYIQLTEAEAAFRLQKSDLQIRPVWHQKKERVLAHILVCFLAYVLWKTMAQLCTRAGIGDEPRRVLEELSKIKVVDVVLPTRKGIEIRKRCITRPTDHQAILLRRLGMKLPSQIKMIEL